MKSSTTDGVRRRRLRIIRLLRLIVKTSRQNNHGHYKSSGRGPHESPTQLPSVVRPTQRDQPDFVQASDGPRAASAFAEAQPARRASWRAAVATTLCGGGLLATSFLIGAQWRATPDRLAATDAATDLTQSPVSASNSAPGDTSSIAIKTGVVLQFAGAGSPLAQTIVDAPKAPCVAELRGSVLVVATDRTTPDGRIAIRVNGDGAVAKRFRSLDAGGDERWVLSDAKTGREGVNPDEAWVESWTLTRPGNITDKLADFVASAPWPVGGLARATNTTGCTIAVLDAGIRLVEPPALPDPDFPD